MQTATRPKLYEPAGADRGSLLTAAEVCSLLSVSPAKLERMKAAGELPPHVVLGSRCHRWRRADIAAFVESRLATPPKAR